jgi:hypothetical protein
MDEKKPYSSPTLVVYGRVEDITRTGCLLGKQLGLPSDINFQFFGKDIPLTECQYS